MSAAFIQFISISRINATKPSRVLTLDPPLTTLLPCSQKPSLQITTSIPFHHTYKRSSLDNINSHFSFFHFQKSIFNFNHTHPQHSYFYNLSLPFLLSPINKTLITPPQCSLNPAPQISSPNPKTSSQPSNPPPHPPKGSSPFLPFGETKDTRNIKNK